MIDSKGSYESEKSLLDEVGRMAIDMVRRYLDWEAPYDDKDFEELWNKFMDTTGRKSKRHGQNTLFDRLGDHGVFRKADYHIWEGNELKHDREMAANLLRLGMGLNCPVPLSELKDTLLRLGATELGAIEIETGWMETGALLSYPIWSYKNLGGLRFCLIGYLVIPRSNDILRNLSITVIDWSYALRCHPALALEYLLCDTPVYKDIAVGLFDHGQITVYTRHLEAPPELVRSMYSNARLVKLKMIKGDIGTELHWPKPRFTSERIITLVDFIGDHRAIDWRNRWEQWNSQYPHWAYRSKNSMQATYYRFKRLLRQKAHSGLIC